MPNGQFHGNRRPPAIRIKNPLRLTVEVTILDGQGFSACRTLKPGTEVYVKVPHAGDYDIKTSIIRYDETGNVVRLGEGDCQPLAVPPMGVNPRPAAGPRIEHNKCDVSDRRWRNVVIWNIPQGFAGLLNLISIQLSGDAEARIELPGQAPYKARKDTSMSFQNNVWVNAGQVLRVKGRSRAGNGGTVDVIIQGQFYPVGTAVPAEPTPVGAPGHITEKKPRKEPEVPPLRSLREMIEEMKEREEVKV